MRGNKMKDIKFRAWDKDAKTMIYYDYIHPISIMFNGIINYGGKDMTDDFELTQYTGLKDKNGKEIYEGDILLDTDTQNIREIIYNAPSFVLKDDNEYFYWTFHANDYIVIGNIFENPELLKEE
jgi:uncharacterized phage protein (TIGR01671 family)